MKFSKNWLSFIIPVGIIVLIVIVWQRQLSDIRENGVLVNVKIIDILFPAKGGGSFSYRCSFNYKGEQHILTSPTSLIEHGRKYVGKFCPAVYSPKGNNLRVLLRPEDFTEYNIPFTDSLIEVINSINQ